MPKSAQICDKVAQIYQNRSKWWCLISASEETATPPPKKNDEVIYEQPLNPLWFASFLYSALSLGNSWERLSRCAVRVCLRLCRFLLLRAVLPHLSLLFCRRRGGRANGGSTPLFALSFSLCQWLCTRCDNTDGSGQNHELSGSESENQFWLVSGRISKTNLKEKQISIQDFLMILLNLRTDQHLIFAHPI